MTKTLKASIKIFILFALIASSHASPTYAMPTTPSGYSAGLLTNLIQEANSTNIVFADTYYVDGNSNQAVDDESHGSEALPWKTIQYAAEQVEMGDTVIVKAGTYPERVSIEASGTEESKITFKAEPRRSVVMEGFQLYGNFVRIEGFEITNSSNGWDEGQGIFNRDGDYAEIVDNYFHDLGRTAIEGGTGGYVGYNDVYHCQKGIIANSGTVVEYNTVQRLFDYGNGDVDYSRFTGENIVFRGNRFHNTDRSEIGEAHLDCWQTFDNTTSSRNVIIEGNFCSGSSQVFMGEGDNLHATSNILFRNNIFVGATSGCGALCMHEITNVTVINNTFVNIIGGPGVNMRSNSSGIVKNNIFYDSRGSYNGNTDLSEGDYNLIYECATTPSNLGPNDIVGQDPLFVDPTTGDFHLQRNSPAINAGTPMPGQVDIDFDGNVRPQGPRWDIGAYEFVPALTLHGLPGNQTVYLTWEFNTTLPNTTTWTISYEGTPGEPQSPIVDIDESIRAYNITDLTNYELYTFKLTAVGTTPVLSDTIQVMPTDRLVYLPLILR